MLQKPEVINMENVKIRYSNFSGRGDDYNREGDRHFTIELDPEAALYMKNKGFFVKENHSKNGDEVFYTMKIRCNWNDQYGIAPKIYMVLKNKAVLLSENTVKRLDDLYIISADISITTGSKPWKERTTGKEYWGAYASIVYAVTDGNSRYRNDQFAKKYEFDNPFASAETLDMADDSLPF